MKQLSSKTLVACLAGVIAVSAVIAKSPVPAAGPAPSELQMKPPSPVLQTMPADPGNLLNRPISVPTPPTVQVGPPVGIGYWSYVYGTGSTKQYCVEPKLFTCGPSNVPLAWSTPPVVELLDASNATVYAITLPQAIPLHMLNANNAKPTLGPAQGSGSLVQWCATDTNFPAWKIKIGNQSQKIEWNQVVTKRGGPLQSASPC